jgi:LmbE family N-acetylglucosaminyl deacetylase
MNWRSLFGRRARGGLGLLRRLASISMGGYPLFDLPVLIEKPEGTRIVVIAPHADDETLGCGGTILKHHLAGDRITALFMTDGSQGHEQAGGVRGQALVELREGEARAAADALGIDDCIFLRHPDCSLECSPATVTQLRELIASLRPDVMYVPSPFDTHRDHRQACAIAARAVSACAWPTQIYLYEVWAPLPANCTVAIDLDRKVAAVRLYRSQMDARELYVTAAVSLARYRGLSSMPGQDVPAECFLRMDPAGFARLAG